MATKKEQIAQEVAKIVGAGKAVTFETVNFNDPNRPKTCLEVDFPILPINQIAAVESSSGAATKPIYQMSKWWARRPSSVFRSMLIAAAIKAPDDVLQTSKTVWDHFYSNYQKKNSFKGLKVFDIFMGGGTTLVEGSRLGMEMFGNDLNPVAWFVVKQELANIDISEVKSLLADIEAEVRPQIMPYYYCDGPNGEKGIWTHRQKNQVMGENFDPTSLAPEERSEYSYIGPEQIYTFWAKHGPCQVTGCGHRTPIMTSPVMAVKSLSIKYWEHICTDCKEEFHIEETSARMAPDVPLYVAASEFPHTTLDRKRGAICPHCGQVSLNKLGKAKTKKVELSLLVHPEWLQGSAKFDSAGNEFGGAIQDTPQSTSNWNTERASHIRLLEVRGALPESVTCPETNVTFNTGKEGGTVPKRSHYSCGACGTIQDVLETVKASGKTGPIAGYAIQGYSPARDATGAAYGGRFFAPFGEMQSRQNDAVVAEWEIRKSTDLADYWPKSELPYGFMTHHLQGGVPNHGFTHWWTMFNQRQLLVHALLLKAIHKVGGDKHRWETREFALGAFQQFLRFNCMFTVYHPNNDQATKHFANNNFHPRNTLLEVSVFAPIGDGRWTSAGDAIVEGAEWRQSPWDLVSASQVTSKGIEIFGKTEKVFPGDSPLGERVTLSCGSSSELDKHEANSIVLLLQIRPLGAWYIILSCLTFSTFGFDCC